MCTDVGCGLCGGRLNSVKMGCLGICCLGNEAMEHLRGGGRTEGRSEGCLENRDYTFIRFHSKVVCRAGMAYLASRLSGRHGQPVSASLLSLSH